LISASEASSRRQRTQRRTTRTPVENTWHKLEAKIAEVMKDFIQGLDLRQREFETLAQGVGGSTGTDAGRAQTSKFDGSTSWPVFHHQFETMDTLHKSNASACCLERLRFQLSP
jgi:hypothetical protein